MALRQNRWPARRQPSVAASFAADQKPLRRDSGGATISILRGVWLDGRLSFCMYMVDQTRRSARWSSRPL